ncbi:MAG TPA: antibiotic biosynthesis monooxygenase [Ilumatobacteraceae bacterium]|nr:antibiotic biosynthesis monooxygenase [Ilumatobacteraceae bacterium]
MSFQLSGSFDTSQLPRVAADPVTVTVARTVVPGHEAKYLRWADQVVATVRTMHGCLGAGVLHPGPDSNEHQIVFRFVDGVHLRAWEKSPERAALMAQASEFVASERVQRTVGVEDWFELPSRAEPKRSLWGRIVTDVLWVYPVAILVSVFVAPKVARLSVEVRVVLTTLLITVVMRIAVGPLRSRLRSRRTL